MKVVKNSKYKLFRIISITFLIFIVGFVFYKFYHDNEIKKYGKTTNAIIYDFDSIKSNGVTFDLIRYFYIVDKILYQGSSTYNKLSDEYNIGDVIEVKYLKDTPDNSVFNKFEKRTCNCTIFEGEAINTKGKLSVTQKSGNEEIHFKLPKNKYYVPLVNGSTNELIFYQDNKIIKKVSVSTVGINQQAYTIEASFDVNIPHLEPFDLKMKWNKKLEDYEYLIGD